MTGLLTVDGVRYIFRDDTLGQGVWAWYLHDTSDKPKTDIDLFDLDDPPPTVRWFPFN